jgi:transcriptional regulator with XRE-family HTH domain
MSDTNNLRSYSLRRVRESRGLNQRQLAERAGVSQSTITRAERGAGDIPAEVFAVLRVADMDGLLRVAGALERPKATREAPTPLAPELSPYAAPQGREHVIAWERAGGSPSLASRLSGGQFSKQAISRAVQVARLRKAKALVRSAFGGADKKVIAPSQKNVDG